MEFEDEAKRPFVSVVMTVLNMERTIKECLESLIDLDYPKDKYEIIVVDDYSTDNTRELCEKLGAKVVTNEHRRGYVGAIKTGFERAIHEIIVTLDNDGEHDPGDIPRLIEPILMRKADLVLGKRENITPISERFINSLINFKVKVVDSGTGFRALKQELASKLNLKGKCTCGILVLEANHHGARIVEVPITLNHTIKKRNIAWSHLWQIFYVLRELPKPCTGTESFENKGA